jgi:uncharacterized membrane protein
MKTWMWRRLSERRQDERGAILILSALFLIVMVLAAALALDIGLEGVDKRSDHKVADLAALDGARAMNDSVVPCVDATRFAAATLAANQSALRNGFNPVASDNSLALDVGKWDPATHAYTPVDPGVACTANAVHVVVHSVTHYKFQPFSQSLSAEAVATPNEVVQPQPPPTTTTTTPPAQSALSGGFKLGSFLANMDSTQAALVDEVVCQALTGVSLPNVGALPVSCPKFNLSAVSWQGLGNASITMDELGKALAANGVIGSPTQVGGATVQADQLFKATGDALTQKGDTADAQVMYNLAQGVSGHPDPVVIAKLVDQQGSQGSAFAATQPVNVADLVVGSATSQIANGTNALAVIDTGISVPNATSGLNLAVIQGQSSYDGPVGPSPIITSTQLSSATSTKSGLNLQLNNLPVSIPGLSGVTLSGTVTLAMTGAGAQAQMKNPVCLTGVDGWVQPQPYHTSVTGSSLTLNIPLSPLSVGVTAAQDVTSAAWNKQPLNYSADFNKDWRVGSTSLQFSGLNYSVTVNGSIPLVTTLQGIQDAVGSKVNSTVALFDPYLSNLYRELGLAVGGADFTATHFENLDPSGNNAPCSSPTTTTAPAPTTTTTTATTVPGPVLVK